MSVPVMGLLTVEQVKKLREFAVESLRLQTTFHVERSPDWAVVTQLAAEWEAQRDALEAYEAVYPCPGILLEPGQTSGCDAASTGANDCPTCGALAASSGVVRP